MRNKNPLRRANCHTAVHCTAPAAPVAATATAASAAASTTADRRPIAVTMMCSCHSSLHDFYDLTLV
jgi:hypothetical protein